MKRESRISLPFSGNLRTKDQCPGRKKTFVVTRNGWLTKVHQCLTERNHLRGDHRPDIRMIGGERKILRFSKETIQRRSLRDVYFESIERCSIDLVTALFHRWTKFQIDLIHRQIRWSSNSNRSDWWRTRDSYFSSVSISLFSSSPSKRFEPNHWSRPSLSNHSATVEYFNKNTQISLSLFLHHWSTNLSLNRFDCLPMREAKGEKKVQREEKREESRETIDGHSNLKTFLESTRSTNDLRCCDDLTSIVFRAEVSFRSIFFDRSTKESLQHTNSLHSTDSQISSLTLHASHVTAPKWIPDADAPQTRQGSFLYKSSLFRSFTSIDRCVRHRFVELKRVLPEIFIPTARHFLNRQYWHWVRLRLVIKQHRSFSHWYFFFPSTFIEIERKKNF